MNRLTKKWQIFLYAISGMGINMLNLMVGSYLCSALLVGGFGEQAIPYQTYIGHDLIIAGVWMVFGLVAKIIDGIVDIPMASFTDNLRSRWGRRRPSLLIGLIGTVFSYTLFLIVPDASGATVLNTVYYGVILCIFYITYTLTMVTYYATFTEIVDNEKDRNTLSNVKSVCDIVYFILGYVVVRALLNGTNVRIVALLVLPLAFTMVIPLFMIKEPSNINTEITGAQGGHSVGLMKSLVCTFKNKTFILWMVVYSFMTFGVQLFLGGINEYFSFVGMNMILVMASSFSPVPLTLILYNRIYRKKGFGFAFRYALLTFAIGMLGLFCVSFLTDGTVLKNALSIVAGCFCSLSIGSLFSVAYSVPAQLAAEEEEKTGVANSAMYFAVQGLFAGIASGIATGVVLTALKGAESSRSSAITYMTPICAVATLVSFVLIFILPKKLREQGIEKKEM